MRRATVNCPLTLRCQRALPAGSPRADKSWNFTAVNSTYRLRDSSLQPWEFAQFATLCATSAGPPPPGKRILRQVYFRFTSWEVLRPGASGLLRGRSDPHGPGALGSVLDLKLHRVTFF